MSDNNFLWVSIGENCLTQNIIRDLGLNTLHSPFSWGRSSIDHVLYFLETDFREALDIQHFQKSKRETTVGFPGNVGLSNDNILQFAKVQSENIHDPWHDLFEWTHHDISQIEHYQQQEKRIQRFLSFKNVDNLIFLYFYKIDDVNNPDTERVIKKLQRFLSFFKGNNVHAALFYVNKNITDLKRVESKRHKNILEFEFYTDHTWDTNAEKDRYLQKEMIEVIKGGI